MIRDITLGQYYPAESWIHKLDPRIKIAGTFAYLISLFVIKDFWGYIPVLLFLGICVRVSTVPFRFMVKGLRPVFFLIFFTFMINMFMTKGTVLLALGPLTISQEGAYRAVFMAFRLCLLIVGSSLLTLATKPISLTDGIEKLLKPFRRIGVQPHELAMMMTIALRFIPTLLEEADKIMKAQIARGADFESGNILQRAKSLIPLMVPLFISAFRIAADLAMAMEARCYRGGDQRTRMNGMKLKARDGAAFTVILFYLAVIIVQAYSLIPLPDFLALPV